MALMFLIPLLNVLYWVFFNHLPAGLIADLPAVAQFGFLDPFALISGAIVVLISWIMEEGYRLENEQVYTV